MSQLARMGDSVTVSELPRNLEAYAGYVDGHFKNFDQVVAAFPTAHHLSITVQGNLAQCGDFEPGAMDPRKAGQWAKTMIRLGVRDPWCYADQSDMPAVKASLLEAGLHRSQYILWIAEPDGNPTIPPGYDAKQYDWEHGFDLSSFRKGLFAPKPKPKKKVHPKVKAGATAGAVLTALAALIHQLTGQTHLTPAEVAAATTLIATLASYLKTA